eukprot:CAMPEP_0202357010 /NCGR_PEP_ID=MMETSP1126-20121109/11221_1 /ASSEMBLY_ACC=CAM_ASM_000457 /TAXON_ID=3047 /ORGANISM="Dunaliella tertiolecta, Strain CCMP1320" /LENGTH=360 /DNA_ID=CAMNT_0048949831 /DNA_START=77 /DNA_END=1159 /DNA_ORIENTATION=+
MGGDKKRSKGLPDYLELQRTHVQCGPDVNKHTTTFTSANVFEPLGIDNSWNLEAFKSELQIEVNRLDDEVMEFDLIGVDPAIANSLRRILLAEVPTVAIEHVFMINNTSIMQDEVLSHRLGLVPLRIDPKLLDFKSAEEAPSEKNTIVFKLDIRCTRQGNRLINDKVTSNMLQWLPAGSQLPEETSCRFTQGQAHLVPSQQEQRGKKFMAPVHEDILLAKLRPGQCIQLEAHAVKGIGKTHAKWSPVATAWYKLLPEVVLLTDDVPESVAQKLLDAAPGLFVRKPDGKLAVTNARHHEKHLEKVRVLLDQEAIAQVVQYRKRKDHFIFTIESTGILPPDVLFEQALSILHDKAEQLANKL